MSITENYRKIVSYLPENVELVAVSKTYPAGDILQIYEAGHRIFGENKVQEMYKKFEVLPKDIQWNLIGHLQTNKVKYIAPFVELIQSVDSEKLLTEINKEAEKNNRIIKILLQIKINSEETKFGLPKTEALKIVKKIADGNFQSIELLGLMGMATFTENKTQIRNEFKNLKEIYDEFSEILPLKKLSMGMSGDYELAIDCGANSVRIGSAIFGSRN